MFDLNETITGSQNRQEKFGNWKMPMTGTYPSMESHCQSGEQKTNKKNSNR
jgi:hypothetical protein